MAQKSLLGLVKLVMRMVLLKPTDNTDESEKALVGNAILVARPSPAMIAPGGGGWRTYNAGSSHLSALRCWFSYAEGSLGARCERTSLVVRSEKETYL